MNTPAIIRLTSCGDVVAAVPYLLGFHPTEALVIVATTDSPANPVIGHFSFASMKSDQTPCLAPIIDAGARTAHLVIHGTATPTAVVAVERICAGLCDAEVSVHVIVVGNKTFTCGCTDGYPQCVPGGDSRVVAQFLAAGKISLPSRAAVAAQLAPVNDSTARDRVHNRLAELVGRCTTHPDPTRNPVLGGICDRARAVVHSADPQHLPPPATIADLAMAACQAEFHGLVKHEAMHGTPETQLALWTWVTRHLPPGIIAPSAVLCAFAAWQSGDAIRAADATDLALGDQAGYAPAHDMDALLRRGVNPATYRQQHKPA